jgi:hypothetical protein
MDDVVIKVDNLWKRYGLPLPGFVRKGQGWAGSREIFLHMLGDRLQGQSWSKRATLLCRIFLWRSSGGKLWVLLATMAQEKAPCSKSWLA